MGIERIGSHNAHSSSPSFSWIIVMTQQELSVLASTWSLPKTKEHSFSVGYLAICYRDYKYERVLMVPVEIIEEVI